MPICVLQLLISVSQHLVNDTGCPISDMYYRLSANNHIGEKVCRNIESYEVPYYVRLRKFDKVQAAQGTTILVIVGWTQCLFQLCLLKYMVYSILIIAINHNSYLKLFRRLSGPHLAKHLHFGGLTFWRNIKSMESSSNMTWKQYIFVKFIKYTFLYFLNCYNILN